MGVGLFIPWPDSTPHVYAYIAPVSQIIAHTSTMSKLPDDARGRHTRNSWDRAAESLGGENNVRQWPDLGSVTNKARHTLVLQIWCINAGRAHLIFPLRRKMKRNMAHTRVLYQAQLLLRSFNVAVAVLTPVWGKQVHQSWEESSNPTLASDRPHYVSSTFRTCHATDMASKPA
jgi:hypothetical protein